MKVNKETKCKVARVGHLRETGQRELSLNVFFYIKSLNRNRWVFEVCVPMHVVLCMFIMQVLVNVFSSQMSFLVNRNDLPVLLFWPVNCIKIGSKYFISPGRVGFLRTKQYKYIEFRARIHFSSRK